MGQQYTIAVFFAMVKAPLTFFEVDEEAVPAHAVELGKPSFGKAPEALDAVNVVFASGELVDLMVEAVVAKARGDQAIVGQPAVGVHVALAQHVAIDNGLQLLARAILDDRDEHLRAAFVQTEHGRLATDSPSSLAAHAPGTEVAFVDLDITGKGKQFFQSQCEDACTPKRIEPMHGAVVERTQIGGDQRWDIDGEEPEDLAKFAFGNARPENVLVCHCG